MISSAGGRRLISCIVVLLGSVGSAVGQENGAGEARRHHLRAVVLNEVISSTNLQFPVALVASSGRLWVYDAGDFSLKCFTTEGRLLWRFGRQGSAPGEFRSVTDLKRTADGDLWIADPGNAFLTIVDSTGKLRRTVPVPAPVKSILPATDGSFLAFDTSSPWLVRYSAQGTRTGTLPVPTLLDGRDYHATELFLVSGQGSQVFAALRWHSAWLSVSSSVGSSRVREHRGIEDITFPEWKIRKREVAGRTLITKGVDRLAPEAANGVAVLGDDLLILFSGRAAPRARTIDRYRASTGAYVGSWSLPETAVAIATNERDLFAIVESPEPRVVRLQTGAP